MNQPNLTLYRIVMILGTVYIATGAVYISMGTVYIATVNRNITSRT